MKIFGQRLKEQREIKGLLQKDIALMFNIKNTTVSEWERGNNQPSLEMIVELAKYFDVSADYLLGISNLP